MGNPAYGQRTPILGLKVESDETRNFNWLKVDDTIGRAFTEGSALQIPPGSITAAEIAPASISSDLIYPGETVPGFGLTTIADGTSLLLSQPAILATIPVLDGNPRHGPTLLTGSLNLTIQNTSAVLVDGGLSVDVLLYGQVAATLVQSLQFHLPASVTLPCCVPLSAFVQIPTGTGSPAAQVRATKTLGADGVVVIKTAGAGTLQVAELA
jgi:hypothetical protein